METITLEELFREITGGKMTEYKFGFDCYDEDNAENANSSSDMAGVWKDRKNYCFVELYSNSLEYAIKEVCGMIQRDKIEVTNIEEVRSK